MPCATSFASLALFRPPKGPALQPEGKKERKVGWEESPSYKPKTVGASAVSGSDERVVSPRGQVWNGELHAYATQPPLALNLTLLNR